MFLHNFSSIHLLLFIFFGVFTFAQQEKPNQSRCEHVLVQNSRRKKNNKDLVIEQEKEDKIPNI